MCIRDSIVTKPLIRDHCRILGLAIRSIKHASPAAAVSYTHLDVYKRQLQYIHIRSLYNFTAVHVKHVDGSRITLRGQLGKRSRTAYDFNLSPRLLLEGRNYVVSECFFISSAPDLDYQSLTGIICRARIFAFRTCVLCAGLRRRRSFRIRGCLLYTSRCV